MSKRSRLNSLRARRTDLKDDSIKNELNHKNDETVSKHSVAEILEPKKRGVTRKRRSVEIKYEEDSKIVKKEEEIGGKNEEFNEKVGKNENNQVNAGAKWAPENWKETLRLLKKMRKDNTAPVDEVGFYRYMDAKATPSVYRFQWLLALMLSSLTKDHVAHAAMERLRAHGCTPQLLVATPDDVLAKLIYPVAFFKRKVQFIKKTCEILLRDYEGDIPNTIEGLCALPGVGPKMGHLCMKVAWNKVTGIGVDTHVHRICNRLNWVKKQAKNPEETRKQLEEWLPKDLWAEINFLLVGIGQTICLRRIQSVASASTENCVHSEERVANNKFGKSVKTGDESILF